MQASTTPDRRFQATEPCTPAASAARIGAAAGIAAGAAYLLAKTLLAGTVEGGTGSEPLLRISALLLGPDALPPTGEVTGTTVLVALLVLLGVSAVYGSLLGRLFTGPSLLTALVRGALIGLALFVVHFFLVAPLAFPWFEPAQNVVTAACHVLFGTGIALTVHRFWRRPAR